MGKPLTAFVIPPAIWVTPLTCNIAKVGWSESINRQATTRVSYLPMACLGSTWVNGISSEMGCELALAYGEERISCMLAEMMKVVLVRTL